MSSILITGSSDGIGLLAARSLIAQGHRVTLHARNPERASQTVSSVPGAAGVLIGDISTVKGMKSFAEGANKAARPFDVVVHNAGVGSSAPKQNTADGFAQLFAVNSLAPYVLTALMCPPKRLVYTSSMLHTGGDDSLKNIASRSSYGDTKLHNVLLANAVARRWRDVESNSVHPGWIKTKLAGSSAPGSTQSGADTLVDLAAPSGGKAIGTGKYFSGRKVTSPHPTALDESKQDELMRIYEELSGVKFPSGHSSDV